MIEKVTDGIKHYFSPGDQIKYYPEDSWMVIYGDVVRVNQKTITISWEGNFGVIYTERVDPRRLNYD